MKLALRLLLGLVLLLALLGAGSVLFIDSLTKQAVERAGTHALGVATRLESASIGLFSGAFALEGLAIANPAGFEQPDFFTLRKAGLELPLSTLMGERITIPALALEGIAIDIERNAKGTNYGMILDNLARFESLEAEQGEGAVREAGKTFVLESLVIRDVRASVNLLPAGGDLTKLSLAIPEIVVADLGTDMTMAQICALVVKTVIQAAIQAGSGVLPEELMADLRARMGDLEGSARVLVEEKLDKLGEKLQEQAEKLGPDAGKVLEEASEKLGGQLEGLLKKKKE